LFNVYLDYWMNYTVMPEDWRPWLGGMAWLNLVGLLAFRIGRRLVAGNPFIAAADREFVESRFFLISVETSKNRLFPERSRPERGKVLVEDGDVRGCVIGRWFLAPFG